MVEILGISIKNRPSTDETTDVYLTHLKYFKFVALFIWIFCCFVTVTNMWGDPINCFSDTHDTIPNKIMTSYCFITINSYQW